MNAPRKLVLDRIRREGWTVRKLNDCTWRVSHGRTVMGMTWPEICAFAGMEDFA